MEQKDTKIEKIKSKNKWIQLSGWIALILLLFFVIYSFISYSFPIFSDSYLIKFIAFILSLIFGLIWLSIKIKKRYLFAITFLPIGVIVGYLIALIFFSSFASFVFYAIVIIGSILGWRCGYKIGIKREEKKDKIDTLIVVLSLIVAIISFFNYYNIFSPINLSRDTEKTKKEILQYISIGSSIDEVREKIKKAGFECESSEQDIKTVIVNNPDTFWCNRERATSPFTAECWSILFSLDINKKIKDVKVVYYLTGV